MLRVEVREHGVKRNREKDKLGLIVIYPTHESWHTTLFKSENNTLG